MSIEEDVEKDDDDKSLTEEQQTELQQENGEMQTRFSRAWVPPVHTVVLDFSVISYVDSVAVKVLSQVLHASLYINQLRIYAFLLTPINSQTSKNMSMDIDRIRYLLFWQVLVSCVNFNL